MVLNIRTFRRNASQLVDGRVVFPKAQIADGIIPTGGQLIYADNGTDVQTQIATNASNAQASSTSLTAAILANTALITAIDVHAHVQENIVYVDSKRTDSYTEDGSETMPYKTLSGAFIKLANGQTAYTIFKLAPGDYVGTIMRDKATQEQSFEIRGSGSKNCFIKGSAAWDATVGKVLYVLDFLDITVSGCCFSHGTYGLYVRGCRSLTLFDCEFVRCGSSGINHEFTRTMVQMDADWGTQGQAGSNRSDGGAMRIRDVDDVTIDNCFVQYCLRGIRVQDCDQKGRISNCRGFRLLESFVYLAAQSYTGSSGCNNFVISNCSAQEIFHSGYLVIGGKQNSIIGCSGTDLCASAVVGFHTQDLVLSGCSFSRVVLKDYIGIGVLGDNYGAVYHSNKEDITDTGGYMLTAVNNSFVDVGVGRASDSFTFYFGASDATPVSFRVIIDGNHSTANEDVENIDSVPLLTTQYPAAGGLSGATVDRVMVTDGNGDAAVSAITSQQLSYLDPTSSIQTQIDDCAKLDSAPNFTGQIKSPQFYVYSPGGNDAMFMMQNAGTNTWKCEHRGGNVRMKISNTKFYMHDSGRHVFEGTFVVFPHFANQSASAGNSKGGIYLDTSTTPPLMKYHDGVQWKTFATV